MQCARSAISKTLLAAVAAALVGCGVVRPSDFPVVCPSYEVTIRPLVESRCSECHSATRSEGGYVVGAHTETVSRSEDGTPRVAPGELSSPFLAAARGERAGHPALEAAEVTVLQDWVVQCRAAPLPHEYHPRGWATSTDTGRQADGGMQFHGFALREKFYRFTECQKCHGEDLRGGESGVDCNSCHVKGPLECNTCHGDKDSAAPPRDLKGARATTSLGVGAHRAHVTDGPAHKAYGCERCHLEVKNPEDEGHYRRDGVFFIDRDAGTFLPAVVKLASGPTGRATWDRVTATCTNTACHAPSTTDTAPSKKDPVWTRAGTGDITCGSCHGAPPSSHADDRCALCHGAGYADGGVDYALHLDGQLELRNGGVRCDSCHAGPESPTFVDLRGRGADAGVQTVGAHEAHLHASRLRGPLTCNECHLVPDRVSAVGHIDSAGPAEVFPVDLGGLAWAQGAMPTYNAGNATCTNYCHGGGDFGHPDTATTLLRTPSWTGQTDQAACGTCHGLPPVDGTYAHASLALTVACDVCHRGTVFPDGGIVFSSLPDGGLTSKHLDGKITGQ